MPGRSAKVLVAEEVPSGNKGEMAILKGIRKCLDSTNVSVELSMLSPFYPERDKVEYGSEFFIIDGVASLRIPHGLTERNLATKILASSWCLFQHALFAVLHLTLGRKAARFLRGDLWTAYQECDLIVVGHDNLFAQPFGSALAFMNSYVILLARVLRKPCVVLAASVGPFRSRFTESVFRFILNQATCITFRDRISYEYSARIGVSEPDCVMCADPAVLLDPAPRGCITEMMREEGISVAKRIVVVMAGPIVYKRLPGDDVSEKYERHIGNIATAVDYMIDHFDVEVVLGYHATFPLDERRIMRDIHRRVAHSDKTKVIEGNYTPEEIKGLIGESDMFIGERTHSLIAAATMSVPCLVLSHVGNNKTNGILGDLFAMDSHILLAEELSLRGLLDKIEEIWKNRELTRAVLRERIEVARELALRNGAVMMKCLDSTKP